MIDPGTAAAAVSSGGNLASTILGGLMSYHSAKKLQQHQYNLNQRSLRESPLNSRRGYVDAGYNPLLALGSQGMGFSANSAGVSFDNPDLGSDVVNSAIAAKQNKAQVDNLGAQTNLVNQQAETEKAKRVQMDFQNAMTDVETHLKQKDLDTYERRFYASIYEQMQRAENYRAQSAIGMMNAETNRLNYQVNSANSSINKYNAETNRYKSDKRFGFGVGFNDFTPPEYRSGSSYRHKPNVRTDSMSAHGYR